jgi:hypothetical protein
MFRTALRWVLGAVVGAVALIALGQLYALIGGS